MENRFSSLKRKLSEFGYTQTLKPECVPLVEKLLDDLTTTTENLQKYMKLSQKALEERDILEQGVEPYKCDNAKLIKECNELHLAFIQFKEQHEKVQRDLKTQIGALENSLEDCNCEKSKLKDRIRELESSLAQKQNKRKDSKTATLESSKSKRFEMDSTIALADEKLASLKKELLKTKEENSKLSESYEFCQKQLSHREDEIKRLTNLLEGGRPSATINKDCCYKNIDNKISSLQDNINTLKRENNQLQNQHKEALAKQHEAMRRALHLAERNKQLEYEMKEMDRIALAVEAECNSKVKCNADKLLRLQDRINESVIMIQNLEQDNAKLKQIKLELSADLDAVQLEKNHLKSLLEHEVEDKKRLNDRINRFNIIENDLNLEIDRLTRLTTEQKRKIIELECQTSTSRMQFSSERGISGIDFQAKQTSRGSQISRESTKSPTKLMKKDHKKTCKKAISKSPPRKESADSNSIKPPIFMETCNQRCCCENGSCIKSLRELLEKEMEYRQKQAMEAIESLKQEKEYYMKEYHKVIEERSTAQDKTDGNLNDEFLQKLMDREKTIQQLRDELQTLNQEKSTLLYKVSLESLTSEECAKHICKRNLRELELLRDELKYCEKERESLLAKIQSINQSTSFNEERMKKAFQEMEEHIRKLEDERKELIKKKLRGSSSLSQLEDECRVLKDQLRQSTNELNLQKSSYNQLKNLHEQTDRSLSDCQCQLRQSEAELAKLQSTVSRSARESATHDKEITRLTSDIQVMKGQLSKLDSEKDELLNLVDDKTEKVAELEEQLKVKNDTIRSLEAELKELGRKVGKFEENSSSRENILRTTKQELAALQKECERERRFKESAIQENRRLQDDLASVTRDCREARNDLEICKRQVEDLTTQVQTYVAEIKRTEDLISQKEFERSELLDQFKNLSQEANILESSNHTLEHEATQSRVQLSVALDHSSDLERRLASQEAAVRSYEKQIAELTSQIASLEIQLKQKDMEQDRVAEELKQMRELCIKLDQERDGLKRDTNSKNERKIQAENTIERLTREKKALKEALEKDRQNLEGVEKLLSESRQELIDQRMLNEDLRNEVCRLKARVEELQERLSVTSEQLDMYQEKAFDYSRQNKQLRREIANERFARSRDDEKRPESPAIPSHKPPIQSQKVATSARSAKQAASSEKACIKPKEKREKTKENDEKIREKGEKTNDNKEKMKGNKEKTKQIDGKPCSRCGLRKASCFCLKTQSNSVPNFGKTDDRSKGKPPKNVVIQNSDSNPFETSYQNAFTKTTINENPCGNEAYSDDGDLGLFEAPSTVSSGRSLDYFLVGRPRQQKCREKIPIGGARSFKNVFTVEGVGIECCISSYKVFRNKENTQ